MKRICIRIDIFFEKIFCRKRIKVQKSFKLFFVARVSQFYYLWKTKFKNFRSPFYIAINFRNCYLKVFFLSTSPSNRKALRFSFQFSFLMAVFLSKIFVYKTSCSFSSAGCMKNVIFHCLTTNLCQNHLWRPRFVLEFCDAIKTQNRDLTSRSHGFFLIWPFSISLVFKFSMFSFFSFSNLCFLSFLP